MGQVQNQVNYQQYQQQNQKPNQQFNPQQNNVQSNQPIPQPLPQQPQQSKPSSSNQVNPFQFPVFHNQGLTLNSKMPPRPQLQPQTQPVQYQQNK